MATFESLGIEEGLLQSLQQIGFQTPTPIQEQAIPVLLQGTKDFIGLAQTGTGKTAAFGLPLLQLIDKSFPSPQALIICPTRELCLQIANDLEAFKQKKENVHVTAVYGGTAISQQIREIKRGTHIVAATPGRLIDLIERKAINLEDIHYVVLDEADEMLNMGFKDDIEFILKETPNRQSTWLFSATMPKEIRQVSKRYMENPFEITVGKANSANTNIAHQYYQTQHVNRYETLKRIIDFNPGMYGIVFTRTKADAQHITEQLIREGYDIEALHGDLTQAQRDKVMARFREKSLELLIATDVAARGIDVQGITHVINYELPDDTEVYTHRSGRTGRAGLSGISISIVTPKEVYRLRQIEKLINTKFNKIDIPSGKDVCRKQFFHFIDKMLKADISHGEYEAYVPVLEEKFENISKEEVLQRVAALEFDRFLKYYENSVDLNLRGGDDRKGARAAERSSRGGRGAGNGQYQRLFVNLGTKDGFYKASFLQFILDMSRLSKDNLGRIDMKEMNSWVEVDAASARIMIKALDGKNYRGRRIRMNDAESGGGRRRG
ncbi:DEAD/DEAH box helicase [Niabella drilacis]|uniref:RNA helicase n=1 Tax=Niabella drilacis (strain DSM 25811 / CCM 8410 / CCUG 62505 / LMG 26954 / E90) TaxID=1285928 RepID=A0A1G6LND2_NIADE|nr:DEAD/DEAH box helicase [Niabella drilacis]SDC44753.1 ATP-dependent RNA helicase DeaD [Niabella drilacis]